MLERSTVDNALKAQIFVSLDTTELES